MAASSESQEIQISDVDYSKDVTAIVDMYINAFEGETQFIWAFQTTGKAHREALKLLLVSLLSIISTSDSIELFPILLLLNELIEFLL